MHTYIYKQNSWIVTRTTFRSHFPPPGPRVHPSWLFVSPLRHPERPAARTFHSLIDFPILCKAGRGSQRTESLTAKNETNYRCSHPYLDCSTTSRQFWQGSFWGVPVMSNSSRNKIKNSKACKWVGMGIYVDISVNVDWSRNQSMIQWCAHVIWLATEASYIQEANLASERPPFENDNHPNSTTLEEKFLYTTLCGDL